MAKVLELQLQHSPSDEYSGLISFTIDWLDLVAVQGTLKSLLQHHSSKASNFQCSAFMVQLSHLYMTTGKNKYWVDVEWWIERHLVRWGTQKKEQVLANK